MFRNLFWLTLGAFAIGTESFVVSGLLPSLSADLGVSLWRAGQLVTAFSLTYAVATPLLAVTTAAWPRERVLRVAMGAFALANVAAAVAPTYGWLVAGRILLAACAGLFMATAGGYAASSVKPEQRGRAMALVYLGLTVATVVGVPLGTLVGHLFGWRATFLGVAALSAVAWVGLCLPRTPQPLQAVVSLKERIAIARRPDILLGLLTTTTCMAGVFAIYTYLSPLLAQVSGYGDTQVALVLMLFGVGSAIGNLWGGHAADALGPVRVVRRALLGVIALFCLVSVIAMWVPQPVATFAMLAVIVGWGVVGWSFPPAQQLNLVRSAPTLAPVVLSLNSSAIYLGVSVGAVLGSFAVASGHIERVGFVGAACEAVALLLVSLAARRRTVAVRPLADAA
jgi:predicted MFS family arabinose efflux permease